MKPNVKMVRLKKHNWFVCLFSKQKREERKKWEARWGKHLTEAQEIEIIPMKYEPHKPFYLDYRYKNTENNMNTFTVYTPISNTGNNEAQDAVSTVKNFSCHLNEQTGQSMIVIQLHEDDTEIKCTFLADPIHTLEKEEQDQYMKVVCNAALSVFYKTWMTANPKRVEEMT